MDMKKKTHIDGTYHTTNTVLLLKSYTSIDLRNC